MGSAVVLFVLTTEVLTSAYEVNLTIPSDHRNIRPDPPTYQALNERSKSVASAKHAYTDDESTYGSQ